MVNGWSMQNRQQWPKNAESATKSLYQGTGCNRAESISRIQQMAVNGMRRYEENRNRAGTSKEAFHPKRLNLRQSSAPETLRLEKKLPSVAVSYRPVTSAQGRAHGQVTKVQAPYPVRTCTAQVSRRTKQMTSRSARREPSLSISFSRPLILGIIKPSSPPKHFVFAYRLIVPFFFFLTPTLFFLSFIFSYLHFTAGMSLL